MISISIIIPVFNVELYIERCLRSVMTQTYVGNIECIIINDGSSDNSLAIITALTNSYNGKVSFKIITLTNNRGPSAARNIGINHATGDYILFLDSDDELSIYALELMANKVEEHPNVDMVIADYYVSKEFADILLNISPEYINDELTCKQLMLNEQLIPDTSPNKLTRRNLLIENKLYFKEGILHEDNLWKWHCAKYVKSIAFLKVPTMVYFTNPKSIMHRPISERIKSFLTILNEKVSSIDSKSKKYQLLNTTLLLQSIDVKARLWSTENYETQIKQELKHYAKLILQENQKDGSFKVSISIFLLKVKMALPFNPNSTKQPRILKSILSRIFSLLHSTSENIVKWNYTSV